MCIGGFLDFGGKGRPGFIFGKCPSAHCADFGKTALYVCVHMLQDRHRCVHGWADYLLIGGGGQAVSNAIVYNEFVEL